MVTGSYPVYFGECCLSIWEDCVFYSLGLGALSIRANSSCLTVLIKIFGDFSFLVLWLAEQRMLKFLIVIVDLLVYEEVSLIHDNPEVVTVAILDDLF